MDIRKQLLSDHSKSNTDEIVFYIMENPERSVELMDIFFNEGNLLKQRAAWVVGDLGRVEPELIKPYQLQMMTHLKSPGLHDAVKRNTLRYLSEIDLDEDLWGEAYEIAFRSLSTNSEKVAIKVFAMTLAHNVVRKVPELKDELRYLIEEQMPFGSTGFKIRGAKILRSLGRL